MKVPDQDELAWDFLDAVRPSLDIPTINRVSMTMADRDYPAVIDLLLEAAPGGVGLPAELTVRLREWASFYAAQSVSVRLTQYLDDLPAEEAS